MLGDGQHTAPIADSFVAPYSSETARFAIHTLRERLAAMHTYWPIRTFNKGQAFDPQEWAPGSVTLFDNEKLMPRGQKRGVLIDPTTYASLELPDRPTDLHPNLGREEYGMTLIDDNEMGVAYIRSIRWGVVVPTETGRNGLFATSVSDTFKKFSGNISVGVVHSLRVPIAVGETAHLPSGALSRTNILAVCLVGSEQRSRRAISRIFLGRFATGHS